MRRLDARVALLAAATAAALTCGAPTATADPVLQADQSTGVAAGQSITVTLAGLPANLPSVAVGQCKPQIVSPADCNLSGALLGAADATGAWQPNGGKRTLVLAASVGATNCESAPGACTLSVTSLTNPTQILTSIPLTFGGAPAPTTALAAPAATEDSDDGSNLGWILGGAAVVALAAAFGIALWRRGASSR
ncbi:neocarzinostatin apoprotein domain-containing protein [Nocardia sp. NPDC003693]